MKVRIGKARTAFTQLGKIWSATKISKMTRLFISNVKAILLYGCETWKVTAESETRQQARL